MLDGRIEAIRHYLDQEGFTYTGIMAYSAKYASAFYGPFRDCLGSQLKSGDKKSYQMDPCNRREGLLESLQDEQEGADILLIKPASHYLDVIYALRQQTHLPIAAYHVSGEYAMLHAAAAAHILDFDKALMEHMISIRRAGADIIITYACDYLLEKGLVASKP
jgi:porphobilinogen synthase